MFEPGWDGKKIHQFRSDDILEVPEIGMQPASDFLDEDIAFLRKFGFDASLLLEIQNRAEIFSLPAAQVLIANGHISERDYYNCVAFELGVPFVAEVQTTATPFFHAPSPPTLKRMAHMIIAAPTEKEVGQNLIYVAPDCRQLGHLKELLYTSPSLAKRVRVTMDLSRINSASSSRLS